MRAARDPVVWLLIGLLLMMWLWHAVAGATPLGSVVPGCTPAYWTMEPEATYVTTYYFPVAITETNGHPRWQWDYIYPTRACCQVVRNAVSEVVDRLRVRDAKILVGECR